MYTLTRVKFTQTLLECFGLETKALLKLAETTGRELKASFHGTEEA